MSICCPFRWPMWSLNTERFYSQLSHHVYVRQGNRNLTVKYRVNWNIAHILLLSGSHYIFAWFPSHRNGTSAVFTFVSSDGSVRMANIFSLKIPRLYATVRGTLVETRGSISPPVAIWASRRRIPRDSVTKPLFIAWNTTTMRRKSWQALQNVHCKADDVFEVSCNWRSS